MNLTSSLLALAGQNLSSTSLQDIAGYWYCQEFYGEFPDSHDCVNAIGLLEKGATEVSYAVHNGIGPHALPLSKSSGTCMVQIDVAGPRLPRTFDITPNDIRLLADQVLSSCVTGSFEIGGFATSDLQVMDGWITAEETKLDRPFRTSHLTLHPGLYFVSEKDLDPRLTFQTTLATSTAFLTVTLTRVVPDWLSPGNYDPIMAYHFSRVALAAIERAFTLRERVDLRSRAERLLRQGESMKPRGKRVPWWENPYLGQEVQGTSLETGNGTVSVNLPEPLASSANTLTSKRRRKT
ncbi:hypothetical protein IMSHALPRED_004304 [Imshaugia aleurites]|uniref:Uncharacterized protein n=1 Tax=Imshaugia aleurites TaxID=172621 RepID=A0A8H3IH22_9LECA|nr:hypothetical protein IMSHALPRED_004304 [Imshaugia aleurites]